MDEQTLIRIREKVEILTGERGGANGGGAAVLRRDLRGVEQVMEGQSRDAANTAKAIKTLDSQVTQLATEKLGVNATARNSNRLGGLLPEDFMQAPFGTAGGGANAIVLSNFLVEPEQLRAGDQYRFRATTANTGASTLTVGGLGARTMRTITGAILPAGYLRTDVDTIATYDADGDFYRISREVERGIASGGRWERLADGRVDIDHQQATGPLGADEASSITWNLPVGVLGPRPQAMVLVSGSPSGARIAGVDTSTQGQIIFHVQNGQVPQSITLSMVVSGLWY